MQVCVIVPSLNPDEKMVNTVNGLIEYGFNDIIVVNDGSDEAHMAPFETVAKMPGVTVLTHEVNKGKGRAMKTAFEYVLKNKQGIDGVVTVDGDGQHLPKDIKRCVDKMVEVGDKVVIGARDFSAKDVPPRSRFGNNLTKAVFRFACGIKISDTQTGLRAIPFEHLELMTKIDGERYEYETNQLLYMKKAGVAFTEVMIDTVYLNDNESSHFHPIRDSIKIYAVIFKFIGSSLASFLVDITLFTVFYKLLSGADFSDKIAIGAATAGARILSSIVNYSLNRKVVFESDASVGGSLWRYYVLCVCQMAASYGLVYLFSTIVLQLASGSFGVTLVKFVVDMCLFMVSFKIQQAWVFK